MTIQLLATKLYTPAPRPEVVLRPRLIEKLNKGLHRKLTVVSAPAGFGKTTLITEWLAATDYATTWLSLDEGDADPARFLLYFIAALQAIEANIGEGMAHLLQSPQPPPIDSLLTTLLNEIAGIAHDFVLVLDDYHVLDNQTIDTALAFLLDNQPPQMHLVITTREDPNLPLARLRARGQLTELRAVDLRFTVNEATEFLTHTMGLRLLADDIALLEQRTEGWIAGLQLAAISMQGQENIQSFIQSFTGSHHFILDYLVEEVLSRQPEPTYDFLLRTSILDRMCGSLCDAIIPEGDQFAQETLESIQQSNLFLIPLDNERHWYRYHHLFGDLLRKRLHQRFTPTQTDELHLRASHWYETNGFEVEAFQHAAAANDLDRAEDLIGGSGVPLYFRGVAQPVLHWLESLPEEVLDARPSLWITYAWVLMATHKSTQIEEKLQAAEAVLEQFPPDDSTDDLFGNIAAIRAMEAAIGYQTDIIITHAHQALNRLHPNNLYVRTAVTRSLAIAYQFRGERGAARELYQKAIAMSEASDNLFINILATTGLGIVQESNNELIPAAASYQRVLELVGDPNQPITCSARLGLARIHYEWNEVETAKEHGEHGVRLAQQIESIDSAAGGQLFLARLKLAQGDLTGAATMLAEIEPMLHQRKFDKQIPVLASIRVLIYLEQGDFQEAAHLVQAHNLPLSETRVKLRQNKPADALAILTAYYEQMDTKQWHDERLKTLVLQALTHHQNNDINEALTVLGAALALAAPGGFIRTFVSEGQEMKRLLTEAAARGMMPEYTRKLLAAFHTEQSYTPSSQPLIEPLSERELEILALVAEGLSNREISERLYLALSTVKGHNRNIFDKLQVRRRTEAVARARELGLLPN